MTRWLTIIAAALIASPASAQIGFGGGVAAGKVINDPSLATQAQMDLYVNSSTGSDANTCLSPSSPCLTPTVTCAKIPKLVRHPAIVHATGTFAAGFCDLEGYSYAPADPTVGAYIQLTGSFTTVTPTSGSATGTFTSYTAAANAAGSHSVFTKTAAGWTASDFKGKFLELTGGTCSGSVMVIYDNDATTITVVGNIVFANQTSSSCTPDATTQFAVQDVGAATITGRLTLAKGGPSNIAQPSVDAATPSTAGFIVGGNGRGALSSGAFVSSEPPATLFITRFLISGNIIPIFTDNSYGIAIAQNRFAGTPSIVTRNSAVDLYDNSATPANTSTFFVQPDADDRSSIGRSVVSFNAVINGALLRSRNGTQSMIVVRGNSVRGNAVNAVQIKTALVYEDFHNNYEPAAGGCIQLGLGGNASLYGYGVAEIGDYYCNGYTGGSGIGMMGKWVAQGTAINSNAWTIAGGVGSNNAIAIFGGAVLMYPAGSTITCGNGAVNCISIDQPHPEDYFSNANLTTAGNMIVSMDGTCISNNSNSSCNAANVGPWLSYTDGGIGRGPMFKLAARPTANLPTSSTNNGELTTGGVFFDSTTGTLKYNDGAQWNGIPAFLPVGSVQQAIESSNGTATAGGVLAVTFSPAFGAAPHCVCVDTNAAPVACGISSAASTSGVTFTISTARADVVQWYCVGQK